MSNANLPRELGHRPILFYDGECGFCNATIQYVLRHERAPVLLFAPLQGKTAEDVLRDANLPADIADKSIVVYDDTRHLIRSRAAARVLQHMGSGWSTLGSLLTLVPRPLADAVYRTIARYRKHLPQAESCQLLSPEKRARFLP